MLANLSFFEWPTGLTFSELTSENEIVIISDLLGVQHSIILDSDSLLILKEWIDRQVMKVKIERILTNEKPLKVSDYEQTNDRHG